MIESDDPIGRAIREIPVKDVEYESVTLKVQADQRDQAVSLEADKDFGKPGGWSSEGSAGWRRSVGWFAEAVVRWRGKKKS